MTKAPPPAVLAQPYTQRQIARFEELIFRANSPNTHQAAAAKAALKTFIGMMGKTRCDMMVAALDKRHAAPGTKPS